MKEFREWFLVLMIFSFTLSIQTAFAQKNTSNDSFTGVDLSLFKWNHGSPTCKESTNPSIQSVRVEHSSFVLRQDKCVSFEAPFIYVLVGEEVALVFDTGDSKDKLEFPLFEVVSGLIRENFEGSRRILVLHSHGHKDHHLGDSQFTDENGVEVIGVEVEDLIQRFEIDNWPESIAKIDLGGRILSLIPSPGHHPAAITLFDHQTGWLLTGDSFYPGSIRVNTWNDFKKSIARLTKFAETHEVSNILGGHVEMSSHQGMYKIGSTYQPDELPLPLSKNDLIALNKRLQGEKKKAKLKFSRFIISPLSWFEKRLSKAASVLSGN